MSRKNSKKISRKKNSRKKNSKKISRKKYIKQNQRGGRMQQLEFIGFTGNDSYLNGSRYFDIDPIDNKIDTEVIGQFLNQEVTNLRPSVNYYIRYGAHWLIYPQDNNIDFDYDYPGASEPILFVV